MFGYGVFVGAMLMAALLLRKKDRRKTDYVEFTGLAGPEALRRLSAAVAALGEMQPADGKTLFESSPLASQKAYAAWHELNAAQTQALQAIRMAKP